MRERKDRGVETVDAIAAMAFLDTDRRHMAEALALAERGRGFVSPNPVVGSVVVRDGEVVGRGWHERHGGPHAEVMALEEAGGQARGATLYVTLEPCCVWGKTPPCSEAIIEAGVDEVIAAIEDPNPDVAGSGLAALRAAGIVVRAGLLAEEASAANAGYLRFRKDGLPSVLLKLALSLDGRVAAPPRGPRWTSSEESREVVHAMRGDADCVLVGIGTVLEDDPLLTDRRAGARPRQPARLVLDTSLRTPLDSALVTSAADAKTAIACGLEADEDKERKLVDRGVDVWRFRTTADGLDVTSVLRRAADEGRLSILSEAGPRVATSLLRAGLVDRVAYFLSPVIYGNAGLEALGRLPAFFAERDVFTSARWTIVGGDALFEAKLAARTEDGFREKRPRTQE